MKPTDNGNVVIVWANAVKSVLREALTRNSILLSGRQTLKPGNEILVEIRFLLDKNRKEDFHCWTFNPKDECEMRLGNGHIQSLGCFHPIAPKTHM